MSTAARSWSVKERWYRRLRRTWLAFICLLCPFLLRGWVPLMGQATDSVALENQRKAHVALAATVQALGGQAWLQARNSRLRVHMAYFFQGQPTGEVIEATVTSVFPDKQRIDTEKRRVAQIFSGTGGWEITYKGMKELPKERLDEHLRWRNHSLGVVLRKWYADPATVLIDQGPSQVERHRTEKIMLIHSTKNGAGNDAVTLEVDTGSHLPLRLSFAWRDPRFHDKNLDFVEYDNYHRIGGIETPFTVTETHNGEVVHQHYVVQAHYNVTVPDGTFDPKRAAAHLK